MIKVSIVVPIYKINEKYLRKSIESLCVQTLSEIEIILVEDGSPDNCGAICDEYAAKDTRIKVIHQENQGVSVARNQGILASSGEYVVFVDGDDWVEKDMCQKAYEQCKKYDFQVMFFQYRVVSDSTLHTSKETVKPLEEEALEKVIFDIIKQKVSFEDVSCASPWGKIFQREYLVEKNLFYKSELKKSQDVVFMLYCLNEAKKVGYYQYYGYIYNDMNDTSICKRYNPDLLALLNNFSNAVEEFIVTYHPNQKKYIEAKNYLYYSLALQYIRAYCFHNDSKRSLKESIKEMKKLLSREPYYSSIKGIKLRENIWKEKVILILIKCRLYGILGWMFSILYK